GTDRRSGPARRRLADGAPGPPGEAGQIRANRAVDCEQPRDRRSMAAPAAPAGAPGLFAWWRYADPAARRALAAGMFGWMLYAFDVMLFALVLPAIRAGLGLTSAQGCYLGSVMLVAAAGCGVAFG